MKPFYLALALFLSSLQLQAGGMSEVDLLSREALTYHFKQMNVSISDEDIELYNIINSDDQSICDFEVSAQVTYANYKGKEVKDTCYVCFWILEKAKAGKKAKIDAQEAYCL